MKRLSKAQTSIKPDLAIDPDLAIVLTQTLLLSAYAKSCPCSHPDLAVELWMGLWMELCWLHLELLLLSDPAIWIITYLRLLQ